MIRGWVCFALALAALFAPPRVAAQREPPDSTRWVFVANSADNTSRVYIDTATIQRAGDTVTVWVEHRFARRTRVLDTRVTRAQTQEMIDCAHRQFRQLAFVEYDGQKVVNSSTGDSPPGQWLPTAPGSVAESELQVACSLTQGRGSP